MRWLRSWFGFGQTTRQLIQTAKSLEALENKIDSVLGEKKEVDEELEGHRKFIEDIQSSIEGRLASMAESLDRSSEVIHKLETVLEAAREDVRIAKEMTIPGLVESHQVLIRRWQAEVQVMASRTAMASAAEGREEL